MDDGPVPSDRSLRGRRVVTTRDSVGELDARLAAAGADVVHVPLIEIVEPPDPGELATAVDGLAEGDWVVITSGHGARRVGPLVADRPGLRLGAVGRATADVLTAAAGRRPDVVPGRQMASELAAELSKLLGLPSPIRRVLVAQADRAEPLLADVLRDEGHDVVVVTAYATRLRQPTETERQAAMAADAVTFASGSAAQAWAEAFGAATPPVVVAIGPTTARVATEAGLDVTRVASDHSVAGLAAAVAGALGRSP